MSRFHRHDHERGATLVEFALIVPLLFFMLGGMLDIGLAVLGRSVATNAAREGARVGIIQFEDAHVVGSPNYDDIEDAVNEKLVGLVDPDTSVPNHVQVRCLDGVTEQPINGTGTCARSEVTVDRDLIEVRVFWTSVAPAGGVFTPDNYDDYARMVITGGGGPGGGGAPCVGSGGEINISPTSESATEGDSITLTVTRQTSTCVTTVTYATADGSATATELDYVPVLAGLTFVDGVSSQTIQVQTLSDSLTEGPEEFTVNLSTIVNGEPGNLTTTVTIVDVPPVVVAPELTSLRMEDLDSDGRLDRVSASFDKDLQPSCPTPGALTFPTNTNGLSNPNVTFTGLRDVQVNLTEGPTADTSAAALSVALAAGCVRDLAGNSATFGATGPTDLAPPVLLSVLDDDTSGTANGTFQQNDWAEFTFSEPLNTGTLGSATSNVALIGGNNTGNDSVRIPGLLNGDISLGSGTYTTQSNGQANFLNSTLAWSNGNRTIRVTLVNACSGSGQNCNRVTQGGQANVTFVFVTTLRALDGLPISSGPISVRLF